MSNENELNIFPNRGPIPQEGIPKIKQVIEYKKQMELKRRAPISEKKKAVKTRSISTKVGIAAVIASLLMIASSIAYNDAKADVIYDNLKKEGYSEVTSVEWFDGFDAYDENGHRVSIDSDTSEEIEPTYREIITEMFKNNIHQSRGGR